MSNDIQSHERVCRAVGGYARSASRPSSSPSAVANPACRGAIAGWGRTSDRQHTHALDGGTQGERKAPLPRPGPWPDPTPGG